MRCHVSMIDRASCAHDCHKVALAMKPALYLQFLIRINLTFDLSAYEYIPRRFAQNRHHDDANGQKLEHEYRWMMSTKRMM